MTEIYIIQRIVPHESENVIITTYHEKYAKYVARKLQNTLRPSQQDLSYEILKLRVGHLNIKIPLLQNEEEFFGEN